MGLSPAAKERALASVFTRGDLFLGLASKINDRGLLVELSDAGYKRRIVRFEIDPGSSEARNKERIVFDPFQADSGEAIRYFFVADKDDKLLADGELQPRIIDAETGDVYSVADAMAKSKELGDAFAQRIRRNYVRVQAGNEAVFPPGAIAIGIGDE